jgi:uncharacterized caspase-like protein
MGAEMWKAALPGVIALVTVGLSLVSGEVVKRDNEHKPILALARTAEPAAASTKTAAGLRASDAQKATPRQTGRRPVALIIGNAAYPDVGLPLVQPVNNARTLAGALKEQGFDVELGENLTKQGMEDAFDALKRKIQPGSAALIFFSGFGIQAARQTYMVPVNAHIWNEADVRRAGVNVEPLLAEIDAKGAGAKLVVLDASRRNPFERRFRAVSMGLAAIHAPDDTLVMYAAAPGKVVSDGETEVSPLMGELVAQIRAPGQTAEEVFSHTRLAVSRASNHEQVPWVSSSLVQDFPFAPAEAAAKSQHSAR